ncbi:MAG: hypothetical protein ACFCU1_03260 [Sumerlaeia bacterium]
MQIILDRLMLSTLSEANDPFFLAQNEIEAILYFGEGGMFSDEFKLYTRANGDAPLSSEDLADGVSFLKETLSKGLRVLAVGQTGATIIIAYLTEMGFGLSQALQMLKESGVSSPKPNMNVIQAHETLLEQRRTTRVHA